jgi:hypothetical protein
MNEQEVTNLTASISTHIQSIITQEVHSRTAKYSNYENIINMMVNELVNKLDSNNDFLSSNKFVNECIPLTLIQFDAENTFILNTLESFLFNDEYNVIKDMLRDKIDNCRNKKTKNTIKYMIK